MPSDRDTARSRPDELIVIAVRIGVVASLAALAVQTDPAQRAPLVAVMSVVAVAAVYALLLAAARLFGGTGPRSIVVSGSDSVLALAAVALTGGAVSLAVAVLPLVVIANSLRTENRRGELFAVLVGGAYTGVCLVGSPATTTVATQVAAGLWWTFYLAAVATLTGVFVRRLDRQYRMVAESRAEVIAEHQALAEERDLRSRLLDSQQARLDGLRVILHEFRAPVVSLTALARAAARPAPDPVLDLIAANAAHLQDMLDGLAEVALTEGGAVGRVRERSVRLRDLALAALVGAGLPEERRSIVVRPPDATVRCDPQRLHRMIGNLAGNAARYSGREPVEVYLARDRDELVVEIRDRGPGLTADQLGLVTQKYVSLGDRRGTAGLGLWIVSELTTSVGGTLTLSARPGGGLVARLVLPVPGH